MAPNQSGGRSTPPQGLQEGDADTEQGAAVPDAGLPGYAGACFLWSDFTLFTDLRMGEVCGLRWDNVNLEERQFLVCETRNRLRNHDGPIETSTSARTVSTTKMDHSRCIVCLSDELSQELSRYREIQCSIMEQYPGYNTG